MAVVSLIGVGLAILAAISLAVQSLTVRIGIRTHTVTELIAVMFAVNLLVLVPIAGVIGFPDYGVTTRAAVAFAVSGLLGSLIARYWYFVGIARLGASRTETLKALLPLFAVGTAVIFLGERITTVLALGVVLLVLGGILVTIDSRGSPVTASGHRLWVDLTFPLAAALFLGIDPVFTKVGLAEGTTPLVGVTIRVIAAMAGFGLYVAWRTGDIRCLTSIRVNRWLVAASMANTAYLLSYYAALARTPVSVVTPILGASTLFVVLGAGLFLQRDEQVTWRLAAAAVIVMLGVVFVVRA